MIESRFNHSIKATRFKHFVNWNRHQKFEDIRKVPMHENSDCCKTSRRHFIAQFTLLSAVFIGNPLMAVLRSWTFILPGSCCPIKNRQGSLCMHVCGWGGDSRPRAISRLGPEVHIITHRKIWDSLESLDNRSSDLVCEQFRITCDHSDEMWATGELRETKNRNIKMISEKFIQPLPNKVDDDNF